MKQCSIIGFVLGLAVTCLAGPDSRSIHVAAVEPKAVSVVLVRQADYVAVPISISSDQRDPVQRFEEIRAAKRLVMEKATENKKVTIKEGRISLSSKAGSKLSIVSSLGYEQNSAAQMTVMVPLEGETPDVFAAAGEITRFVSSIRFPEKVQCNTGQVQLAVADPEQYRSDLLRMIAEEVRRTTGVMDVAGSLTVTGLQSPVLVHQLDETRVELFLNYTLTLGWTEK